MLDIANRAHNDPDGKNSRKPWKWLLVDSAIIGLIAMGATMPNVIPNLNDLYVMAKAFFVAFIIEVAYERGLKRGED